ncbi:hypothetical protein SAY87_017442 [Trapa incisa]|uniref:EDRF1 N-terminal domain-containing protein n=1 Tax=Trapa incisa TaxID=236973 RepID=A0AAN7QYI0_9MYRT|nr:hypothetical protein SAY87_017442 [Trapa incisa]
MEKIPSPNDGSRDLQCVGRLEIFCPKPVGFLCGSIPVFTDDSFNAFSSALIPSRQKVRAPQYQMLPAETDLNRPPLLAELSKKLLPLPLGAVPPRTFSGDLSWEDGITKKNLARKCEALAVSGLVEYGEDIDVIAPTDILKQIFKMPYSEARLSIAVHRIGQTLVLNTGPDMEEGEKLIRRHSNQSKCADQTMFLNFAMHSVRMEACDCPPSHKSASSNYQPKSSVPPDGDVSHLAGQPNGQNEQLKPCSDYTHIKQDDFFWGTKMNNGGKRDTVQKTSQIGEKARCSLQESEWHKRVGSDGFLRVLFWQFHNIRMLLGSDLLLFSNEKYVAVSLHLWDVARQVTPLTWLEAWIDNVMASVPELAICYHENGVVQGYELLKTEDIFILKGISDDGTPAFNPHVVQQNGLSVLRFLQENCKQDPGTYWLYKSAGDDVIRLFDLSVIPKAHSSKKCDDNSSSLPSLLHRGRSDSLFSLGTLLYRIAHRLSLSVATESKAKCASFIRKCLDLLDEPDQLVVRAYAHEQYARLILNTDEDTYVASKSLSGGSEVSFIDAEEESMDFLSNIIDSASHEDANPSIDEIDLSNEGKIVENFVVAPGVEMTFESNSSPPVIPDERLADSKKNPVSAPVQTVGDPISAKLAAINHVSQAIKSLRWMRQLQSSGLDCSNGTAEPLSSLKFSVCACGDADCIEVCDIRQWLPRSKLDHKLWKLVLLLGESYLALAHSLKEGSQLHQALKVVKLACSVYGSMPQYLGGSKFISSMPIQPSSLTRDLHIDKEKTNFDDDKDVNLGLDGDQLTFDQFSSTYLFWSKAWTLVGDIYVEFHSIKDREVSARVTNQPRRELRLPSEVLREVKRLKKKLGHFNQNCQACSLVNCSCENDRVNSGNSASSSCEDISQASYSRRHARRSFVKTTFYTTVGDAEERRTGQSAEDGSSGCSRGQEGGASKESCRSGHLVCSEALDVTKSGMMEMNNMPPNAGATLSIEMDPSSKETLKLKNGGIFKYIECATIGEGESNLLAALSCFEEARKALNGLTSGSAELHSVVKKKGWVCNELGRSRLERKELSQAELSFAEAIKAFKQVSDHTNIILINCNMGHGRRALAEDMVTKVENLKLHSIFYDAYKQALDTAKIEYGEALRFYTAAKLELNAAEEAASVPDGLKSEVHTQFAHTYLRLGMLLANEDTTAEVYESTVLEEMSVGVNRAHVIRAKKGLRKHEISANEAIREALQVYESLGDTRKQEAAYAHFQLGCYQRDCCLKILGSDQNKGHCKSKNGIQNRVKQYASLAERNWQKALDFYGPRAHPAMYLNILKERSRLALDLSTVLHSNAMLESALSHMLEGRHVLKTISSGALQAEYPELHGKFWSQLQMILKKMVALAISSSTGKTSTSAVSVPLLVSVNSRLGDSTKLKELYKMSLKCTDFSEMVKMHALWIS